MDILMFLLNFCKILQVGVTRRCWILAAPGFCLFAVNLIVFVHGLFDFVRPG